MSSVLDKIVNCQISIESPVEDSASFGVIMLIGYAPANPADGLKDAAVYSGLDDVAAAGWSTDSDVYLAAKAAFSQNPKPAEIYILIRQKKDGEAEAVTDAVKRALAVSGWYGLALAGAEETEYEAVAEIIETQEKIFAFRTGEKVSPLKNKNFLRTFGIYSEEPYADVAWLAQCFQYDPGSESWAYKTLDGVEPSALSGTEMGQLEDEGLNYYIACAGKNITRNGKMTGGEWIDVIRFRDWLKNQIQLKVFGLFVANAKIPYTDGGITLVQNQIEAVLKSGQSIGGIADTEYDAEENPVYGYTVTVPRAADLSSAQRESRKLTGVKFTARLANAIHVVELVGNLVY